MIEGRRRIGQLLAAIALVFAAAPAAAQQIGAVIDLNPAAFGTPPASRPSELSMGEGVVPNELIQTLAGASTRIRFLDDSDLRLGQSSMIVLDRLVYDPDQGVMEFVLGIAVGAARFVSGEVDHERFALHTPVALIGIRGTDFVVVVEASGRTVVSVIEGAVIVTPHGGIAVVAEAGQTVIVDPGVPAIVQAGLLIPPDPGLGPIPEDVGPGPDDDQEAEWSGDFDQTGQGNLAREHAMVSLPTPAHRQPIQPSSPSVHPYY
jgi:hypothetical protein